MRNTILIVDDMEVNRIILREIFSDKYNILEAENGIEAIDMLKEHGSSIVVMLLDIIMPDLDGFGVMDYMRKHKLLLNIPVLMITVETSQELKEKGYSTGITDYITKPFDAQVVKKRVNNIIDSYYHKSTLELTVKVQTKMIREQSRRINEINEDIINTLGTIVEFRNMDTGCHALRIKEFTRILLEYISTNYSEYNLKKEDIDAVVYAAAMHDVGKIYIPDAILLKPGKLTPEEFEIIKTHTTKGCEILNEISTIDDPVYLRHCCDIALNHHERYDGGGYPQGIAGDDIPISAQAVSIADVYDALVSRRCYKEAYSNDKAYHMIIEGECGVFNPKLIEAFTASRNIFEEKADSLV